jgi:hypothetical protein
VLGIISRGARFDSGFDDSICFGNKKKGDVVSKNQLVQEDKTKKDWMFVAFPLSFSSHVVLIHPYERPVFPRSCDFSFRTNDFLFARIDYLHEKQEICFKSNITLVVGNFLILFFLNTNGA